MFLLVMKYSNFLKFKLEWKPFSHSFFVSKRTKEIKSESEKKFRILTLHGANLTFLQAMTYIVLHIANKFSFI
jgi:hypothetical protein